MWCVIVEVAGSFNHVNTKTASSQRFCKRDKLIASSEQKRTFSSGGGPWRGFSHVHEGDERCLLDLRLISRRLSCSFIVHIPLQL